MCLLLAAYVQPPSEGGDHEARGLGLFRKFFAGNVDESSAMTGIRRRGGVHLRRHHLLGPFAPCAVRAERHDRLRRATFEALPSEVKEPRNLVVEPEPGGMTARTTARRRKHLSRFPAAVDEHILQLAVPLLVAAPRASRRPLVDSRPRIVGLPDPAASAACTTEDEWPHSAVDLSRNYDLVVLMSQRVVCGELRCAVGASLGAADISAFDPPPTHEVHCLVDEVGRVESQPLIGVIASVLLDLRHIAARMIEGLARPVAVQSLPPTAGHFARIEGD